ncbi:sensor histidine kinase [Streptosporangium sp. 'caverna']|uniref:sensor histidine kinase n=1 Tax=Streptosporangium sp. 'caverna' TaxID=2202249 RepID=UPI000D7E84EB|nr:histidine kinase [Streptosporangium sp. 'caverna']AWS45169.1 two-component sensor histidine kinase [Streptosporangium sp. 'caverna']
MLNSAVTAEPERGGVERLAARALLTAAPLVAALALAGALHPGTSPLLAVPAALTLGTLGVLVAGWPRTRRVLGMAVGAVCLISLACIIVWFARPPLGPGGSWSLLHTAALMALAALACRWSPIREAAAAGTLTVLASAALGLPVTGPPRGIWWEPIAICAFWSLPAAVGAAAGCYLRWLDARRVQAVRQARRAQRVQLATDLHDFVAHDVSAMVIQAQAAQVLLRGDPDEAARVLRRIESDGTRALASMDRTIRMLRELEYGAGTGPTTAPGATELPELIARYAGSGAGPIELNMASGLDRALHQEASTAVYRVVVEALTNVRRHARPGAAVAVELAESAEGGVVLTVIDQAGDTGQAPRDLSGRRRGGVGLASLAERIEALGGVFTAQPVPPAGWRVRAELPGALVEPVP